MAWWPLNYDTVVVGIIVLGGWIALRLLDTRIGRRWADSSNEERLLALRNECREKIEELEARVEWLLFQLQHPPSERKDAPKVERQPAKPLLLIVGTTAIDYEKDREALRRARVPFQRMVNPTREAIRQELLAARQDDNSYVWLHVSSHADAEGIVLADGIASATWWHNHIDGVKVVFLAACKTNHVAQTLAGLTTVIYVMEEIDDQTAGELTYAFWRRMKEHGDPRRSYAQALEECPTAGEFTNIRG